jgi:hypothetical protein
MVFPVLCVKIPEVRGELHTSIFEYYLINGRPGGTRTPNQAVMSRRL